MGNSASSKTVTRNLRVPVPFTRLTATLPLAGCKNALAALLYISILLVRQDQTVDLKNVE